MNIRRVAYGLTWATMFLAWWIGDWAFHNVEVVALRSGEVIAPVIIPLYNQYRLEIWAGTAWNYGWFIAAISRILGDLLHTEPRT